jgi:hypothetical protein
MKVQANPLMIVAGRSRPQLTARSGQNRRVSSDFGKIWRKSTAKRHGPIAGAGGKAPPRTSSKPSGSTKAPTRIKHPDQGGGPTWASAVPALGAEQATHPATLPVAGDGIKTTASSKTGEKTDHNRAPAVPTFEAVKEAKTAQPSVGAASRAMTEAGRVAPNAVRAQPSADQIAAGTHRSANPSGSIATDPRGRRVFRAVFKPMSPKDTKWVSVHPA